MILQSCLAVGTPLYGTLSERTRLAYCHFFILFVLIYFSEPYITKKKKKTLLIVKFKDFLPVQFIL